MCAVSFVGDFYSDKWRQPNYGPIYVTGNEVTRFEFDALKKEVLEMKELLMRAKKYDEETGQPDCEMEDKVALLKKVAELVGVDLKEVFKNA